MTEYLKCVFRMALPWETIRQELSNIRAFCRFAGQFGNVTMLLFLEVIIANVANPTHTQISAKLRPIISHINPNIRLPTKPPKALEFCMTCQRDGISPAESSPSTSEKSEALTKAPITANIVMESQGNGMSSINIKKRIINIYRIDAGIFGTNETKDRPTA